MLFGLVWPERPTRRTNTRKRIGNSSSSSSSRRSATASNAGDTRQAKRGRIGDIKARTPVETIYDGAQGALGLSAESMFTNLVEGTPVLVDPLDPDARYWWPGVVVDRIVEDTSDRTNNELLGESAEQSGPTTKWQVRYFEDGSYSECEAHDMVLFDPTHAPFADWLSATQQRVLEVPAMRRAIAYFEWRFYATDEQRKAPGEPESESNAGGAEVENGGPPNRIIVGVNEAAQLRHLHHSDTLERAPAAMERAEVAFDDFFANELEPSEPVSRYSDECIRPYLHKLNGVVHIVDARDGKAYMAKIINAEFVSGNGRIGLYYLVHYHGWSSRYDEWIPPSRIVY
ncbi:hypothetical protein LPJ61_003843 [Coemansia biformis]|uniref:Tudor-knot domain-containing protein n=1 Tax=Coemansia biformis TaxID=1286918 RepID=A0A9W7Y5W3_9FUNG|nr:hypothetical protein LPJ61_003843 [Coemansia biformis]